MEEVGDKAEETKTDSSWTVGGPVGSRGAVLQFLCSALSKPPQNPPADVLHMTYKTYQAETKLLSALLSAHGFREVPADVMDFNLLWTGVHPKTQVLRSLSSHQRVNHFPRSYELTRKDRLYKNIEKMQHAKGVKHFDFIPQTFVMPGDFRELTSCHYRHRGPWIVKPVASSRGRGIFIVNSPDEVPMDEPVVVAKYIENPLLVSGHKCDLRLYVAVTSYDPLIVYMYEEGLVRFATVKYDKGRKHLWNPCMHLCNYSINKHHSDYIKSEDPDAENVGHKWTLSALLRHLKAQELDTAVLMQRIEEVVVKSLLASATSIVPACKLFVPHSLNCFELYGFDILVDSELKPWLLEVNLSPSLGCDTPLDTRIKSALLADLLTLVGLPAVDPILHLSSNQRRYQHRHLDMKRDLTMSRRVQSADSLPNNGKNTVTQLSGSATILTSEESRVVRNARSQFERRGGFIRIFPSSESWKRYSPYLDPSTGIPSLSNNSGNNYIHPNHNYNLMLHQQLFPESVKIAKTLPAVISSEKLNRYERALNKGHCVSLDDSKIVSGPTESLTEQLDPKVLKEEILKCLEDGYKLSKIQSRQAFSQYLQCVLVRITGKDTKAKIKNSVDDSDSELIMRFLQRANSNLRTQHQAKTLNRSLSGKDKTAIVAKQLSDFLYQYNRETESLPLPVENRDFIPSRLFKLFLPLAKESDLEQVLMQSTRLQNCSQVLFGHCGPSSHKLSNLGLLHSLGRSFTPQDKVSHGDCDCSKKSLPQLLEGTKDNSEQSSLKVARAL